ncbi:MAG: LPS export ABC transporter ATP-binding protein [Kiritimatiellae bacterium]|nr:LPS export ABC transporter ATP-binding protein [Kiritimatiellia bacterium]
MDAPHPHPIRHPLTLKPLPIPHPHAAEAEPAPAVPEPVPAETPVPVPVPAEAAEESVPKEAPAEASHTLLARDLVKSYKGRTVVRGVTIHVDKGEVVGLLGPNGAGKTTSFYMILGLVRPDRGEIVFQGEDITKKPVYKRARAGLGYLAQEPSIFRKLTVEQNIAAILETTDLSRDERKRRLDGLLERFDLAKVRKQYAYTLSGGERRKLEIARALVQNPAILMLDEPFAGVDPIAVEGIRSIVHDLKADGYGILITDHNVRETLSIVDRGYILIDGTVIKEGSVDEIVSDPVVRKEYLTDDFRM